MNDSTDITQIHHLSDFSLLVTAADTSAPLQWPEGDFDAVFTTDGTTAYRASRRAGVCTNCHPDGGAMRVIFDHHRLAPGRLRLTLTSYTPDADFPDGVRQTVSAYLLAVSLTRCPQDLADPDSPVRVTIPAARPFSLDRRIRRGYMPCKARPGIVYAYPGCVKVCPVDAVAGTIKHEIDLSRFRGTCRPPVRITLASRPGCNGDATLNLLKLVTFDPGTWVLRVGGSFDDFFIGKDSTPECLLLTFGTSTGAALWYIAADGRPRCVRNDDRGFLPYTLEIDDASVLNALCGGGINNLVDEIHPRRLKFDGVRAEVRRRRPYRHTFHGVKGEDGKYVDSSWRRGWPRIKTRESANRVYCGDIGVFKIRLKSRKGYVSRQLCVSVCCRQSLFNKVKIL